MSHSNVCIRALPFLLLLFLSRIAHAQKKDDTIQKNFERGYFNLEGEKLSFPEAPGHNKMIVLTTKLGETKESVIREAIRNHMVIDVPSKAVLDSMDTAYKLANSHKGNEQEFFVGKKGSVSIIVEGSPDAVGPVDNIPARKDLAENKGDEPAYDVHTHGDSISADTKDFGWPSDGDMELLNFRNRLQASVILSYVQENSYESNNRQVGIAKRITFYYQRIKPVKISYSEFINAVQKITGAN